MRPAMGMDLRVSEEGGHPGLTESSLEVTCRGSSRGKESSISHRTWGPWAVAADLVQQAKAGSRGARACGGCQPPRPFWFGVLSRLMHCPWYCSSRPHLGDSCGPPPRAGEVGKNGRKFSRRRRRLTGGSRLNQAPFHFGSTLSALTFKIFLIGLHFASRKGAKFPGASLLILSLKLSRHWKMSEHHF